MEKILQNGGWDYMNRIDETSFTLLTQTEIDTLVDFLTSKKDNLGETVLTQESIDRLIALIRDGYVPSKKNLFDPSDDGLTDFLTDTNFRKNASVKCTLSATVDVATDYVVLSVTNTETNETMQITPKTLDSSQTNESWGYCIAPVMFSRLARTLDVYFTQETYDAICKRFALRNYGDGSVSIPSMYQPTHAHLLKSLL